MGSLVLVFSFNFTFYPAKTSFPGENLRLREATLVSRVWALSPDPTALLGIQILWPWEAQASPTEAKQDWGYPPAAIAQCLSSQCSIP